MKQSEAWADLDRSYSDAGLFVSQPACDWWDVSAHGLFTFDKDAEAKQLVEKELKDPKSAQFEELVRNGDATCGYVNGKNEFGAYGGRQAFVVKVGEVSFDDRSVAFNALVYKNCDSSFAAQWGLSDSRKDVKEAEALASELKEASARP